MDCCKDCENRITGEDITTGCHDKCIKFLAMTLVEQERKSLEIKGANIDRMMAHKVAKTKRSKPKAFKKKPTGGSKNET